MTTRSRTRFSGTTRARALSIGRLLLLAVLATSLGGCDGRLVPATAPFERSFEFTFDSNDGTSEFGTLAASEILGELDIPDDARVQYMDIERVRLTLAPGAGNEADAATLTFYYDDAAFSESLGITVADLAREPVDALVSSTLRAVEDDLWAIISGSPGGPGQITIRGDVTDIVATDARLVLDATLDVKVSVTYFMCEDLGLGPFGPGADCITSENPFVSH